MEVAESANDIGIRGEIVDLIYFEWGSMGIRGVKLMQAVLNWTHIARASLSSGMAMGWRSEAMRTPSALRVFPRLTA